MEKPLESFVFAESKPIGLKLAKALKKLGFNQISYAYSGEDEILFPPSLVGADVVVGMDEDYCYGN